MNNTPKRTSQGRVCCVPGCSSTYRRNPELKFYCFPNREWEVQRKKIWIARVRRKSNGSQPWVPTKYTRICSSHFVGREKSNDPRKENYNPTIFPWKPEKATAVERRERLKARNDSKEIEFPKTNNNVNYGNMELAMEFATFCNICFNKQSLRKIEETEHILDTLMIFIENKIVLKDQEVYLCLNCCEKLEIYDQFKEMCLVNFADFRLEYSKFKNKLETCNDVNMEAKLRNFIETKVYGANESLAMEECENFTKVHLQNSENNLIETQSVINDNNYDFHSVRCKIEENEFEDNEEYKFHTDVHLKNNEDEFELPVTVEHIKMEPFIEEDIGATESSGPNEFIEPPKCTESLPQYEEHVSNSTSIEETHKEKKRYSCSVCDKTYTKITNLKAHEGTHTGEMAHICNICNKAFGLPDRLKEHMFLHSNELLYTCLICNKNFKTLRYLKRHKVSHTDEKPFACSRCDKTFTNSGNLKMHENVHTGEKPYTCEICQKAFRLISSLNLHKRIHTGEKPYTCEVCQKSFRLLNHVRAHERIHSGEKPYECPVCKMRFTQLHSCKIHQLTHTGEKPHSCNVCKKTFRELNTLKDHERLHTGDRPYNCDICQKSFIRRDQLRKHNKRPCVAVEEQIT